MSFSTVKSYTVFLALVSSLSTLSVAYADEALAHAKGCTACHQLDAEKVGPPFRKVAKQYQTQSDALSKLSRKVLEGGSGTWGEVAMPANKTLGVTEADVAKLVSWVLSLK